MSRGRKPLASAPIPQTLDENPQTAPALKRVVDEATVAALREDLRLTKVDGLLGLDGPYDRALYVRQVKFLMRRTVDDVCQIGRMLAAIKEHEPSGNWLPTLDDIGISERTARRMMQASLKFGSSRLESLKSLPPSKLYELMIEDDEDLEALADGGSIAGMTLDAIDRLSPAEMRARLRNREEKHQAELDAARRLSDKKSERIEALETEIDTLLHGTQDAEEQLAASREEAVAKRLADVSLQMLGMIAQYEAVIAEVLSEPSQARTELAVGTTNWLYHHLWRISVERGWLLDFRAAADPAWIMKYKTGPEDAGWAQRIESDAAQG